VDSRKKSKIDERGRPKRYYGRDVDYINLSLLKKKCDFLGITDPATLNDDGTPKSVRGAVAPGKAEEDGSPEAENDLTLQATETLQAYQFKRLDGKRVNYFTTIKDDKETGVSLPNQNGKFLPVLEDWLEGYIKLIKSGSISYSDITVVPIVQVRARSHFNTLVIHGDDQGFLHVYIVEPRSSNRRWYQVNYPVKDIKDKIENRLAAENTGKIVKVKNVLLEEQSFFDDETCGAHQVNTTEVVTQLSSRVIADPKELTGALRCTSIERRDEDKKRRSEIIAVVRGSGAQAPAIGTSSKHASVAGDDIDDGFRVVRPSSKQVDVRTLTHLTEQNIRDLDDRPPGPNALFMAAEIEMSDLLDAAISEIDKYVSPFTLRYFKSSHTRQQTKESILDILDGIKNLDDVSPEEKRHRAAMLLFLFYDNISDTRSKLRRCLEQALIPMLDCKVEYDSTTSSAKHRDLFIRRLALLKNSPVDQWSKEKFNLLHKNIVKINEMDTSSYYKKHHNDSVVAEKRKGLFQEIRVCMGLPQHGSVPRLAT